MKVTFIGTGEACDPLRRNTSVLIEHDHNGHLLDCGFTAAQGLLARNIMIQTIWISHFHGDHCFGLPQLIVHFYQQNRSRPLTILSGKDGRRYFQDLIKQAYPNIMTKLNFPLRFLTVNPGELLQIHGLAWRSAPVNHSGESFGLQVCNGEKTIYYSGDGYPTSAGMELISGSDLVIHEAHLLSSAGRNDAHHCSIEQCQEMASSHEPSVMALVHLSRETRQHISHGLPLDSINQQTTILIPDDGDSLEL